MAQRGSAQAASDAFLSGLQSIVPRAWLNMFNQGELGMLIGGGNAEGLDMADLQHNAEFTGGYHEEHPIILALWQVQPGS